MATIDKKIGLVIGPQGPQGPQGNTGPQGATGATGATPNLTIGTVTTLEPDASATATITGTAEDPVLNLGIPRGQTGEVTEEEFTQLKEDLNDVNAELLDIRVGADGTTYASAGAAVRGQFSDIKEDLNGLYKDWGNLITEYTPSLINHWTSLSSPMKPGNTYKIRFMYDYDIDLTRITGNYIFIFKGASSNGDTSQTDAVRISKTDVEQYPPNVWHEFKLTVSSVCNFMLIAYGGAEAGDHVKLQVIGNVTEEIEQINDSIEVYDAINIAYNHATNTIVRTFVPYNFIKGKTYKVQFTVKDDYTASSATNVTFSMKTNASLNSVSIVDIIVPDIRGSLSAGTYEYTFTATGDAIALYVYQYDTGTSFECAIKIKDGTPIIQKVNDLETELQSVSGMNNGYEYNAVAKLNLKKYTLDCALHGVITIPTGADSVQGCGIYNGLLVQAFNKGMFGVYDLSDMTLLSSGNLGSAADSNHCNSCMFGAKYDNSDPLPLFYVTCGGVGNTVYCAVERFTESGGTYTASVIQNITFDYDSFVTSGFKNIYPVPNFFVDDQYLYLFGALQRTNGSTDPKTNRFVITKFALPDPAAGNVTLTGADIYDQFVMPYTTEIMQGGTLYDGLIYHLFGYGTSSNEIRVFDVKAGIEVANIDALSLPYGNIEPESCAVYDEQLYIQTGSGALYKITF